MMPRCILALAVTIAIGCDGQQSDGPKANGDGSIDGAGSPGSVARILGDLEEAGRRYPSIAADIDYRVEQKSTGDSEHRTGRVKYQAETDKTVAKFYVRFETLRQGKGPTLKNKVEYAFDGRWLTVAQHPIKQMTRYELAGEGEKVDILKLGKSPFPLPFGQKAETMRKYFEITTRPRRDDEPENTDYLLLIPRKKQADKPSFTRLEMWIDRRRRLPVRLISRDKSKTVTTVTFDDIATDQRFTSKDFHLPRKLGWTYSEERPTSRDG